MFDIRVLGCFALCMLLPGVALAQDSDWTTLSKSSGKVFAPDDAITKPGESKTETPKATATKPEIVEPSRALLPAAHALCESGQAKVAKTDDGYAIDCEGCPNGATSKNGALGVTRAYRGAFSSPTADELLVATHGCGGGFNFRNSAVLLRKERGKWRKVQYKSAFFIDRCTPFASGTNAGLICLHSEFGQGSGQTYINLVSVAGDSIEWVTIGQMNDGSGGCYYTPKFTESGIYKREMNELLIDDIDDDGHIEVTILYTAHHAETLTEPKRGERCDESNYKFTSTPKAWVLEVDGHRYRPNPGGLSEVESTIVKTHFGGTE